MLRMSWNSCLSYHGCVEMYRPTRTTATAAKAPATSAVRRSMAPADRCAMAPDADAANVQSRLVPSVSGVRTGSVMPAAW